MPISGEGKSFCIYNRYIIKFLIEDQIVWIHSRVQIVKYFFIKNDRANHFDLDIQGLTSLSIRQN